MIQRRLQGICFISSLVIWNATQLIRSATVQKKEKSSDNDDDDNDDNSDDEYDDDGFRCSL